MCMACINGCPEQAIDYGVGTVGRERYRFPAGMKPPASITMR